VIFVKAERDDGGVFFFSLKKRRAVAFVRGGSFFSRRRAAFFSDAARLRVSPAPVVTPRFQSVGETTERTEG